MPLLMGDWTFFYDGGVGTLNLSGLDASGRFSCMVDVETGTALTNIGFAANPLESFGFGMKVVNRSTFPYERERRTPLFLSCSSLGTYFAQQRPPQARTSSGDWPAIIKEVPLT